MANFILIGLCICAGMFFRKSGKLPKDAHKGMIPEQEYAYVKV